MCCSDAPVSELSLELLLLQVVLPALLEQGYTRQWLKGVIRKWCIGVAWLLDLRSYLLGEQVSLLLRGVYIYCVCILSSISPYTAELKALSNPSCQVAAIPLSEKQRLKDDHLSSCLRFFSLTLRIGPSDRGP